MLDDEHVDFAFFVDVDLIYFEEAIQDKNGKMQWIKRLMQSEEMRHES